MKRLIVSDIHIGDLHHEPHHARFKELLQETEYDELILNGDVFDLWKVSSKKLMEEYQEIINLLERISRTRSVIYIRGNHDDRIRRNMELIPLRVKVVTAWDFSHPVLGPTRVVHGDKYDETQRWRWLALAVVRLQHFVDSLLRVNLMKRMVNWLRLNPRRISNALLTAYTAGQENKDVHTLIMGHTHLPGCLHLTSGPQVWNSGDFVDNLSYLIIDDNGVQIYQEG